MKKTNPCSIRVNPWLLLLPNVTDAISEPACRNDLLLRVELDAFFPLNVQVSVKRIIPASEREHRHRGRDADVDADHAGFDAMLEFAGGFAGVREDRGAVSVR